ncbi:MAG: hypothetical protein V2A53_00865 [bacterium]
MVPPQSALSQSSLGLAVFTLALFAGEDKAGGWGGRIRLKVTVHRREHRERREYEFL